MSEVPSAEEYAKAFREAGLPESYRKILRVQYHLPNRAVTSKGLADAMSYKHHSGANLSYGTLAKRVGKQLGWHPNRYWQVLATGDPNADRYFSWVMRPQVAEALEELEWTQPPDGPPPPPVSSGSLNTILFGPPGTGKTYSVQRRAVEVIEVLLEGISDKEVAEKFREYRDEGRIEFVTFHPSFSYEEFVEGFRYDPEKKVPTLHDGVFKEISVEAQKNTEKPYVLIIDEINRGNISRIFGELITLLEPDKRRGTENELSTRLPYSGENFSVPKNLHIIGTMNTADRSIALLDVALRRRFEFEEMMPEVEVVREVLAAESEMGAGFVETVCSVFEVLNARITTLLDRDHMIGHSYFLSATSPEKLHHALYRRVFPLLQEYFYNDPAQLRRLLGEYDPSENTGFVDAETLTLGKGFSLDANADDAPWSFHEYEAEELEDALENTFLEG